MDKSKIREFIASSEWFEEAPDDILDRLVDSMHLRQVPANTYLWAMGETNTEMFGIVDGRVRMYISSAMGQEFALIDREDGAWLGEACMKDDEGRLIGARTMTESSILVVHRQVIADIAQDWPLLYRNLFLYTVTTSRFLYRILSAVLFYPLKTRVAGRLLYLIEEHGEQVEEGTLIDMKVSQNDFARLAMGSRQRVNRIFREWDKQGLVLTRGEHLLIKDRELLEQEMQPFE